MPTTLTVTLEITVPDQTPANLPHGQGWTFGNLTTAVQRLTRSEEFHHELMMAVGGDYLDRQGFPHQTRTRWVPATADAPRRPGHLSAQVTARRVPLLED